MAKLKLTIEYVYEPDIGTDEESYGECETIQDALNVDRDYVESEGFGELIDYITLNLAYNETWKLEIVEKDK